MAKSTDPKLNQSLIYEVSLYNFAKEPTFASVEKELDRIKDLGVDIIWFIPIHPRGVRRQMSTYGSAYAVKDYRAVNPDHGTMDDFGRFIDACHAKGMDVMIDVVYNHASADSVLIKEHPEWFWHGEDGKFFSRVWKDVVDLDFTKPELWDYLIDCLVFWAQAGVDGFRCDVGPAVPVDFWKKAREAVAKVNPDHVWLSESSPYEFIQMLRKKGWYAASDVEEYEAFDITYDFDVRPLLEDYLSGKGSLALYIEGLIRQQAQNPSNYIKLHYIENHDLAPIYSLIRDYDQLLNWTAFIYFIKGTTLIYNGQEFLNRTKISVGEGDLFDRSNEEACFTELLKALMRIKKMPIVLDGWFSLDLPVKDSLVKAEYTAKDGERLIGLFNMRVLKGEIALDLPDGTYENLLGGAITVSDGKAAFPAKPVIISVKP